MNIKYNTRKTIIKSNWLDYDENKNNTYIKIGGWKGLYLYFNLYKFKINTSDKEDTFITSISLLSKVTGYDSVEIFNLLLKFRNKIIKFDNISRTDQLLMNDIKISKIKKDNSGNYLLTKNQINCDKLLIIKASDLPQTKEIIKNNKIIDIPIDKDNMYIYISFEIFEMYEELGFDGRYNTLYCLMNKWNNNIEKKMYMTIEKISEHLGDINKNKINKIIWNMNKHYVLYSSYRKRKDREGLHFEHHLATSLKMVDWIKKNYKDEIDKRYDK